MKNLGEMLFISDVMSEVFKALKEHRTVIELEWRRCDSDFALNFELHIKRQGDLLMPMSRRPMNDKKFKERAFSLNARRFQRVRPGRKAARDDASKPKEKQK